MNLQSVKFQGLQLVDPNADYSGEQVIYLDFDGEQNVTYNNPALGLTVSDITVTDSGLTADQIHTIVKDLNTTFADTGVTFTVTKPLDSEEYSTIYVGGTGAAFSEYGNFLGLAETIDAGNQIKTDNAFVFSDKIASNSALTETITHEAAHLLGYQHEDEATPVASIGDFAATTVSVYASADTYVNKLLPNSNFSSYNLLSITRDGMYDSGDGVGDEFVYIKFNLDDIPSGADIQSAKLRLYGDMAVPSGTSGAYLDIVANKGSWTEGGITWNNKPNLSAEAAAKYFSCSYSSPITNSWFEIDITSVVEYWIEDDGKNYGVQIGSKKANFAFKSREISGTTYDPVIIVSYVTQTLADLKPDVVGPIVTDGYKEGEQYTFSIVDIKNNGTKDSGSFKTKVWLSTDTTLNRDTDYYLGEKTYSSISKNGGTGSNDFSFTMPNLGSGEYSFYVIVEADSGNEVAESDETNNIAGFKLTGKDNVKPADLEVSENSHNFGASGTSWSFKIGNIGNGTLNYNLSNSGKTWLNVSSPDGSATTANEDTVTVTIDRSKLSAGVNTATIVVTNSNDANDKENITITVTGEDNREWGPLITFDTWDQRGVYNDYCPEFTNYTFNPEAVAGCVAIAAAQVLYYWNYPNQITVDADEKIYINGKKTEVNAENAEQWNFATVDVLNSVLSDIDYNFADSELAALCFAVGIKYNMNYGPTGSGASTADGASIFLEDFGFGSARLIRNIFKTNVWTEKNVQLVIDNIKRGQPVIAGISNKDDSSASHSVVIDGYRANDNKFHVNLGWGRDGEKDWYSLPEISAGGYTFNRVHCLIVDILPGMAWSQSRSDSANSGSSPMSLPSEKPVQASWKNSFYGNNVCENVIIGVGSNVYAAVGKKTSMAYTGHIFVYDKFGSETKDISISMKGDEEFRGLAQAKNGTLYVLTSSRLLKIDSSQTELFSHNDAGFEYLKIDSNENCYFSGLNNRTLYRVDKNGQLSSWSPGNSSQVYASVDRTIAIDEQRGRIWVTWASQGTKRSYLELLDINLNSLSRYELPEVVTNAAAAASSPSVGADGTVYLGSGTVLYAFKAEGGTIEKKWSLDGYIGRYDDAPTIAQNGTIYVNTHKNDYSTAVIVAIRDNSNSAQVLWEHQISVPNEYDHLDSMAISANGILLVDVTRKSDLYSPTLSNYIAIQDNGTRATRLWETEASRLGNGFVLGTNQFVMYDNETLTAYKGGEIGDPYGAGMGYENNHAPEQSVATQSIVSSRQVTLNWEYNDPDGHNVYYDVYLSNPYNTNGTMDIIAWGTSETSIVVDGLKAGENYIWQVMAHDGQAYSATTAEGAFETETISRVKSDFNGDGTSDVINYSSITGFVKGYISGQTGERIIGGVDTTSWGYVGTGDFNGDSATDILWQNKDTGLVGAWLLNKGSGEYSSWSSIAGASRGEWEISGIGDFNDDGTDDVLWYNTNSGLVGTWLVNNGIYSSWSSIAGTNSSSWKLSGIGDFNGDGTDDVLWCNTDTGLTGAWLLNNGNYSSWNSMAGADLKSWKLSGIGDFNGDGTDDVLWCNTDTGLTGAWLLNNGNYSSWNSMAGADLKSWKLAGVGDYNGDRTDDVLWCNTDTGLTGYWQIENSSYKKWVTIA